MSLATLPQTYPASNHVFDLAQYGSNPPIGNCVLDAICASANLTSFPPIQHNNHMRSQSISSTMSMASPCRTNSTASKESSVRHMILNTPVYNDNFQPSPLNWSPKRCTAFNPFADDDENMLIETALHSLADSFDNDHILYLPATSSCHINNSPTFLRNCEKLGKMKWLEDQYGIWLSDELGDVTMQSPRWANLACVPPRLHRRNQGITLRSLAPPALSLATARELGQLQTARLNISLEVENGDITEDEDAEMGECWVA